MVWQTIDGNVLFSESFILGGTMNADLYLNGCLGKRLIPFIKKNYPDNKILFWHDLATAHYSLLQTGAFHIWNRKKLTL